MLLPPSEREQERGVGQVQGQAQQLESEPVPVPEPLGLQVQQPPPSQRWPRHIQALQWLASSCHHASIAQTRLSKRNR